MSSKMLLLLLACGCPSPRSSCDVNGPKVVELRDGKGALVLAAAAGEKGALDFCSGTNARVASFKVEGATAALLEPGGAPRLNLRRMSPENIEASSLDNQPRFRVHRDGKELHVLDPTGIRLGSILLGEPKSIFYDRHQVPAGTIEARGPDQAIRDPEGATLFLVQPAASSQSAGVFTVSGLLPMEQMALYLFLSR
jgi:hypothetical protein